MKSAIYLYRFAWLVLVRVMMLACASGALGESGYNGPTTSRHHFDGHGAFGYDSYGYHSSTALEGALRGKAALVDAAGRFQVNAAEAAILREQARALDRENDFAHIVSFRARLELARKAREEARTRRALQLEAGRAVLVSRQAVVQQVAYRLNAAELDVATGQIRWPAVFSDPWFDAEREKMQELFARQARYASPDAETAAEIARCSARLSKLLRPGIRFMPRDEYLAAQRFLLGLKYAASLG